MKPIVPVVLLTLMAGSVSASSLDQFAGAKAKWEVTAVLSVCSEWFNLTGEPELGALYDFWYNRYVDALPDAEFDKYVAFVTKYSEDFGALSDRDTDKWLPTFEAKCDSYAEPLAAKKKQLGK